GRGLGEVEFVAAGNLVQRQFSRRGLNPWVAGGARESTRAFKASLRPRRLRVGGRRERGHVGPGGLERRRRDGTRSAQARSPLRRLAASRPCRQRSYLGTSS